MKIGKPIKYLGIKPRMILEKLKNDVRRNAEERIVGLSNIKTTEEFTKLEDLYKTGIVPIKGEDITAALQGRLNISNHLREVLQNSEKEVIICTSASEIKSKLKLFQQTFSNLNKANIKINIALSLLFLSVVGFSQTVTPKNLEQKQNKVFQNNRALTLT
ncbi:MAG: hypothetical protein KGD67_12960, partial [Candidatus Lokiarchaeota archaeon]|nr:hypothetical protein [Candidatus Lokiarchaeota archaeon]